MYKNVMNAYNYNYNLYNSHKESYTQPINKIFQIGFNKCGTRTIHNFFSRHGIKSAHWENNKLADTIHKNYYSNLPLLTGIDKYKVYTDMENVHTQIYAHILYYKELDQQYPNSKFILNIRDRDKWIKSRLNHSSGKYLRITMNYHNYTEEQVIDMWINDWENHIRDIKDYFKDRPNDLLIFNIEEDEVSKLVKFFSPYLDLNEDFWEIKGVTNQHYKIYI